MSLDYTALAATAVRLLTNTGQTLTFTRKTEGAFNPSTGKAAVTETAYEKKVAVTNYASGDFNDIILQGDLKLVCESYTYSTDDTVSIDSKDYRIIRIDQIKPAATEVAVILQVRA